MLHVARPIREEPPLQRAVGHLAVGVITRAGRTELATLAQKGCCRCLMPRRTCGTHIEAVVLNTSGGITGGDELVYSLDCGDEAALLATTQTAERVYRSSDGTCGRLQTQIHIGQNARLAWLPQETILFEKGALERRLDVTLSSNSSALLMETVVLGRIARGETIHQARLIDHWRVRRDGKLVFADTLRLEGDLDAIAARAATASGTKALATMLLVSPEAEERLEPVRALLGQHPHVQAGASCFDGMLIVRLMAQDPPHLRRATAALVTPLAGLPLPRVWSL